MAAKMYVGRQAYRILLYICRLGECKSFTNSIRTTNDDKDTM